jgi:hypothetical protein
MAGLAGKAQEVLLPDGSSPPEPSAQYPRPLYFIKVLN